MFSFLNALNEDPPDLQVVPQHKRVNPQQNSSYQPPNHHRITSLKSSHNQSPFASRPQEIENPNFEPINQATIESNGKSEQNQLKKIKNYSKILQNTSHLHKMYQTSSPSNHQLQSLTQGQEQLKIIGKQRLTFEVQNAYNYYVLKNERKNRVLAKAKELGKNNFYRFLKETSLIGSNQHMHRLYSNSKNVQKLHNSPLKTRQMSPNEQTLMVVSLEPNKNKPPLERKKKHLGLPKLLQRQTIKHKITLKTQMPLDHNLCLTTQGSTLSLKKNSSKQKHLIRNLTQINQKIRKNRKFHHDNQKLLFPTQNLSMKNQQTFLSKWKYKSLFDSGQNTTVVRKTDNQKKQLGTRMKTFTGHLISRMTKFQGTRLKGMDGFESKVKFLKISRSNLMKKEVSELSLSAEISLNSSKLGVLQQ